MFTMKKNSLLLAFALLSSNRINVVSAIWNPDKEDCTGCSETGDEFTICINEYCGGSKEYCLGSPPFASAYNLVTCCDMSNECSDYGKEADNCVAECLPDCVEETTINYMTCSLYQSTRDCEITDCISGIVLDRQWSDIDATNSDEFFQKLAEDLDQQSYFEAKDCVGTESKAKEVCDIGDSCCQDCNDGLSDVMDCIVNDMVRPWQLGYYGLDSSDSEYGGDCDMSCASRRKLQEPYVFSSGNETLDAELKEMSVSRVASCATNMQLLLIKQNTTLGEGNNNTNWVENAGDEYLNCMVTAGVNATGEIVEDGDSDSHDHGHSSSSATSGLTFLTFAASLLALNNIA